MNFGPFCDSASPTSASVVVVAGAAGACQGAGHGWTLFGALQPSWQ